jgi:hypothetical protein
MAASGSPQSVDDMGVMSVASWAGASGGVARKPSDERQTPERAESRFPWVHAMRVEHPTLGLHTWTQKVGVQSLGSVQGISSS